VSTVRDVMVFVAALAVGVAGGVALHATLAADTSGPDADRVAYEAYSACLSDMVAERTRWEAAGGGSWVDPTSCAQPTVSYGDYRRAYSVTWADYGDPQGQSRAGLHGG
jgi:hypothetical protein